MLYNIVLVSAMHQHESAIDIHMSSPSWASLPPSTPCHPSMLSQSTGLSSPHHRANSHRLPMLHTVVYMFQCCRFLYKCYLVNETFLGLLIENFNSHLKFPIDFLFFLYFYLFFPTFYSFNLFFVCLSYKDLSSIRICIFFCFVHSWISSI